MKQMRHTTVLHIYLICVDLTSHGYFGVKVIQSKNYSIVLLTAACLRN